MNICVIGSCRWRVRFRTYQASKCTGIPFLPKPSAATFLNTSTFNSVTISMRAFSALYGCQTSPSNHCPKVHHCVIRSTITCNG